MLYTASCCSFHQTTPFQPFHQCIPLQHYTAPSARSTHFTPSINPSPPQYRLVPPLSHPSPYIMFFQFNFSLYTCAFPFSFLPSFSFYLAFFVLPFITLLSPISDLKVFFHFHFIHSYVNIPIYSFFLYSFKLLLFPFTISYFATLFPSFLLFAVTSCFFLMFLHFYF